MAKILLRRVPRKTDHSSQQKVINAWNAIIIEKNKQGLEIPIISPKDISLNKIEHIRIEKRRRISLDDNIRNAESKQHQAEVIDGAKNYPSKKTP